MNTYDKWNAVYEKEKQIVEDYKKLMKPHQQAMTYARVLRNQSKKRESQD